MRKNNYNRRPQRPKKRRYDGPKDTGLTVYVRDGNVDQAPVSYTHLTLPTILLV